MSMWRKTEVGDWYWPLHPHRPEDHLRVWRSHIARPITLNSVSLRQDEWSGALVIDGEYLDHVRVGPYLTAQEAMRELYVRAHAYLAQLSTYMGMRPPL